MSTTDQDQDQSRSKGMNDADRDQNAIGAQQREENQEHSGMTSQSQAATGSLSQADQQFLRRAAKDDAGEVQLAKLAEQNASAPEVKQLAQKLETQHSQNLQQLQTLAQQKGVNLPDQPEAKQQAEMTRLQSLKGQQFDQAYTSYLTKEHKKDIAEFQREQNKVQDPDLKSYISQTLPHLQQHEQWSMQAQKGQPMSTGNSAQNSSPNPY